MGKLKLLCVGLDGKGKSDRNEAEASGEFTIAGGVDVCSEARAGFESSSGRLAFDSLSEALNQTDADVASFDGGFGSALLARQIGQKRAREIFFLGRSYSAQEAHDMGMVNEVVPHAELEDTAYQWAQEILEKSPTAIRMIKFAFNMIDDGMVGQQVFAGEATRLAYMTDEAEEGRNAFLEKRKPDFKKYPWLSL